MSPSSYCCASLSYSASFAGDNPVVSRKSGVPPVSKGSVLSFTRAGVVGQPPDDDPGTFFHVAASGRSPFFNAFGSDHVPSGCFFDNCTTPTPAKFFFVSLYFPLGESSASPVSSTCCIAACESNVPLA